LARTPLLPTDPSQVGRYRLVARLGAGGMGVVYLGEANGRQVAVKVLRPELADDPEFRVRFGREVSTLTRVQGVCTIRVIEADTQAPKPFLVTEYADGPSLSEYVATHGPLDPQMLYGLATGLAEALTAIHAAGIVHRDLKPSNVLLTAGGPKVIDFGIAQALDTTSLTRTGITVGSAGFMAPEQVTGRAGTAADIFTWAVTVAFAASGQPPFGTGASDVMLYRIMHAAPDISAVPPGLHPLVEAALAKEPQARPTAPQLLTELTRTAARPAAGFDNPTQTILAQTWHTPTPLPGRPAPPPGYPAPPPSWPAPGPTGPPPSRPARRSKVLLPVVLALAFVLAAGGTALGLTLAGRSSNTPAAASTTQTQAAQVTTPAAASSTPYTPASTPATTPASTSYASTPASTPVSSSPAALPVLTVGSYAGMKPNEIAYSGDATNVVTGIQWSSWTATGASGQGTSDIDSCNPNCAQASPSLVPTTVALSAPVNGRFTKMTETRNGFTSTYTYPDNWPQSAS
jgi:serine/threonine protein kinase